MDSMKFDLPKLLHWVTGQALEHGEKKTGLPLGEMAKPIADGLTSSLGIAPIDIHPLMFFMGRLVLSGMDRQKQVDEAVRQANANNQQSR